MNYGSCGEFQIKAEPEYAAKVKMMAIIVNHADEIESALKSVDMPITRECREARSRLSKLIFELCQELDVPAIVAFGRKGGSNVAAAICNALAYGAADMLDPTARGWQG